VTSRDGEVIGAMAEAGATPARRLGWDACYNVRDMGGYPTADGRQTRWRAIVRADNLCRLTPAGCAALVAYGVRTIIDLRNPAELLEAPHPFAGPATAEDWPAYLHRPFEDATDATAAALMTAATSAPALYGVMLDRFAGRVAGIVAAIAAAPPGGVLIHCHAGKDRTGLVSALLLALAGVPEAVIAEDYALSDVFLRPFFDEWWNGIADPDERAEEVARWRQRWGTPVQNMRQVLTDLTARHGGAAGYLRAAGVDETTLARLRARLSA
jgi:hypothetical protein